MMIFSSVRTKYHSFLWYLANKGITPNQVTIGRTLMFLIVIIFWMLSMEYHYIYTLPLLIIISIPIWVLDMVDGDLARVTSQMTEMGKWLDPLADKIKYYLAMSAFLIYLTLFEVFLTLIMLFLDVLSTLLRKFQYSKDIGANIFGKLKLVFQVISMISFALYIFLHQIRVYQFAFESEKYVYNLAVFSLISAIILAIISVIIRNLQKKESIF